MKRKAQKLLASVIAFTMSLLMSITVIQAEGRITNNSNHSYNAYQIFSGSQKEGDTTLGSIQWGIGFDAAGFIRGLKQSPVTSAAFQQVDERSSAQEIAEIIARYQNHSEEVKTAANIAQKNIGTASPVPIEKNQEVSLANGWYLLVDTTKIQEGEAYVPAFLMVTNGNMLAIAEKYSVPSPEKKIIAVDAKEGSTTSGSVLNEAAPEQDSASAEIGDLITFQLSTTLPSNLSDYDAYKLEFEDTLSSGLKFVSLVSITIDGRTAESEKYVFDPGTYDPSEGTVLHFTWDDICQDGNAADEKEVVITYTAELLSSAVVGIDGNPNTLVLHYANNPNGSGEGTSAPDEVKVYTFRLTVRKREGSPRGNGLAGAGFILKNQSGKYYAMDSSQGVTWVDDVKNASEYISDASGNVNPFNGLAAGTYTLHEQTVPDGYTAAADREFVIKAEPKAHEDGITLTFSNRDGSDKSSNLSIIVVNQKGVVLPSTGAYGTRIFHRTGLILMAAGILLLIRKISLGKE